MDVVLVGAVPARGPQVIAPALGPAVGDVRVTGLAVGRPVLPVVLAVRCVPEGVVGPTVVPRRLEVVEEQDVQGPDIEVVEVRRGPDRRGGRVARAVVGTNVVVHRSGAGVDREGAGPAAPRGGRHEARDPGAAVDPVHQFHARDRRVLQGGDRRVDHEGPCVRRVRQLCHAGDADQRQVIAREALVPEALVDIRVVGRAVVDVPVVVIQGQPLGLDDRVDLGLVEGAHPGQEERIRGQGAGTGPQGRLEPCADLPGCTHPDLSIGVHLTVAAPVPVPAVLACVEAGADVTAASAEVLADDRFVVEVHGPDVRVALTHAVRAVAGRVEHVEPVPVLVHDHGAVGGVHAAAAGLEHVDRHPVEECVAGVVEVRVADRLEVGGGVRRVDRDDPVPALHDADVTVGLGGHQGLGGGVHQHHVALTGLRLRGQAVVAPGIVTHVVVGADVVDRDVERPARAREVEAAVLVGEDRARAAGDPQVAQVLGRLGVRARVGQHSGGRVRLDRTAHVEVLDQVLVTDQLAVHVVDPEAPGFGDLVGTLGVHVHLPGEHRHAALVLGHGQEDELRLPGVARLLGRGALGEEAQGDATGRVRVEQGVGGRATPRGHGRGLHGQQVARVREQDVQVGVHHGHPLDLLSELHVPLVGAPDLAQGQEGHLRAAECLGHDAVHALGGSRELPRHQDPVLVGQRHEVRRRRASVEHVRVSVLSVQHRAPARAVLAAPGLERRLGPVAETLLGVLNLLGGRALV